MTVAETFLVQHKRRRADVRPLHSMAMQTWESEAWIVLAPTVSTRRNIHFYSEKYGVHLQEIDVLAYKRYG